VEDIFPIIKHYGLFPGGEEQTNQRRLPGWRLWQRVGLQYVGENWAGGAVLAGSGGSFNSRRRNAPAAASTSTWRMAPTSASSVIRYCCYFDLLISAVPVSIDRIASNHSGVRASNPASIGCMPSSPRQAAIILLHAV
jgi:hypothetical protein